MRLSSIAPAMIAPVFACLSFATALGLPCQSFAQAPDRPGQEKPVAEKQDSDQEAERKYLAQEAKAIRDADEKLLREHHVPLDGAGLLKYFRDRTLSKKEQRSLRAKVQKLASANYTERAQISNEVIRAGNLVKPFLVEILKSPPADLELLRRAEVCLKQIEEQQEKCIGASAARILAHQNPPDAARVLLDYLPFVTEDYVVEEIQEALNSIAVRDGVPEPALFEALNDSFWVRRKAAGEALVRATGLEYKVKIAHLLEDVPHVRMELAMALVEKHDRQAVPVLIDTLGFIPADKLWAAEDLLHRLAGPRGPNIYIGPGQPIAKVQEAWKSWWKVHAGSVNFAKLEETERMQGLTLVTQMGRGASNGTIQEVDQNKKVRWQMGNLRYPVDAQVIGPNRVLVVEYLGRQVTERDFEGKILWQKQIDLPICCQRLPNGNTFIATRRQLLIIARDGKEVFTYQHPNTSISAARRARDGSFYLVNSGGTLHRLDARGREIKSFQVGSVYTLGGNIDILPGGNVVIPLYRENKVVEYDANGRVVWQWQANGARPTSVSRLPNGHTLVTSSNDYRVVEIDRGGQVVWEYRAATRPWRASRR